MQLEGPDSFRITILPTGDPKRFAIADATGAVKFSGKATSPSPKLYVVSANKRPIYVGITKQRMRQRLRLGWTATGESGYHGYQWRHHYNAVGLDIWYQVGRGAVDSMHDLETVEAEVVFLIRQHDQWPAFQTEIHFHESTPEHRALAEMIWSYYRES
ncbi:MAG: hypothetical protein IIA23_07025 [Chloroflexi bacterium]|nr:hypothetical protein [Chloroflexota bacterium]